jgi:hypothetical protein
MELEYHLRMFHLWLRDTILQKYLPSMISRNWRLTALEEKL